MTAETPILNSKVVKCQAGELLRVLRELKESGYVPSMVAVKNVCDYTVTAFLDWREKSSQKEAKNRC